MGDHVSNGRMFLKRITAAQLKCAFFNVFNYAGTGVGWWTCVVGAAQGLPWAGPLVVSGYLGVHLWGSPRRAREARFLSLAALVGLAIESGKKASGLITYAADWPGLPWLAPLWIVFMWPLFASTLHASLGWLRRSYWLAAVMGAIFGPLSYLAGDGLGAITLTPPVSVSVSALALIWGSVVPALVWLAKTIPAGGKRTDGTQR